MKYLIRLLGKTCNVQVVLMCAHKLQSRMVCSMHPSFLLSHSFHLLQPHMAVYIVSNHFLLSLCSVCALWEFSNKFMSCCGVGSDSHLSLTCKLSDESVTLGCPVAVLAQWSP